jgi:hypothetical protein
VVSESLERAAKKAKISPAAPRPSEPDVIEILSDSDTDKMSSDEEFSQSKYTKISTKVRLVRPYLALNE